jgi:hypothetical protein
MSTVTPIPDSSPIPQYIEQRQDETDDERSERHHKLNTSIKNKKKVNARTNYSPQKRKHVP